MLHCGAVKKQCIFDIVKLMSVVVNTLVRAVNERCMNKEQTVSRKPGRNSIYVYKICITLPFRERLAISYFK